MNKSADTAFLGHPKGLAWLSFSEFWERFSYYGMQGLLVLYMTHQLLLAGHVERVMGFGPFRAVLERAYGPLSPQALASVIFGFYAGLVYLTPIGGGILADRFIGRTRAVIIGASLMTFGHFLMAFDQSFLLALVSLLIGVGCFKGNIATQVGGLYPAGDARRSDAYQVYFFCIQLAVIIAPLICGTLGETYSWHWGFGAAGVGMLAGLAIYLAGRSHYPPEAARVVGDRQPKERLSAADYRSVVVLVLLLPLLAVAAVCNQQIFNAYMIWAEGNYEMVMFGMKMPVTWLQSLDAAMGATTIMLSVLFWRWWAARRPAPDEITKLTIGAFIASGAPLVLAFLSWSVASGGGKVGLGWAVVFEIVNDIGFANLFPVGLALYSRAAPKQIAAIMIGVYYLHLFATNTLVGWLGTLLERMPAANFWLLHAGLVFGAAVGLLLVRAAAGRILAPVEGDRVAAEPVAT